ncbi:MAG: response regulator [bacterium]
MINKILVIDDNTIFCNALKYHLSQKEYSVETCVSCSEFQDKDVKEYDLILLDIKLKDAQGLDIIQYILEICPEKKIIIISSYLDEESILKANKLGAYKCIHKSSKLFQELDNLIKEI